MALSGVALAVFGAGLYHVSSIGAPLIGKAGIGGLMAAAVPDLERYLKLKSM